MRGIHRSVHRSFPSTHQLATLSHTHNLSYTVTSQPLRLYHQLFFPSCAIYRGRHPPVRPPPPISGQLSVDLIDSTTVAMSILRASIYRAQPQFWFPFSPGVSPLPFYPLSTEVFVRRRPSGRGFESGAYGGFRLGVGTSNRTHPAIRLDPLFASSYSHRPSQCLCHRNVLYRRDRCSSNRHQPDGLSIMDKGCVLYETTLRFLRRVVKKRGA